MEAAALPQASFADHLPRARPVPGARGQLRTGPRTLALQELTRQQTDTAQTQTRTWGRRKERSSPPCHAAKHAQLGPQEETSNTPKPRGVTEQLVYPLRTSATPRKAEERLQSWDQSTHNGVRGLDKSPTLKEQWDNWRDPNEDSKQVRALCRVVSWVIVVFCSLREEPSF